MYAVSGEMLQGSRLAALVVAAVVVWIVGFVVGAALPCRICGNRPAFWRCGCAPCRAAGWVPA